MTLVKAMVETGEHLAGNEVVHLMMLGPAPYVEPEHQHRFRHSVEQLQREVKGRFPLVCVSLTFEDSTLPSGATAPSGWATVVAAHSLESL